jgi:hypothetical protein
MAAENEQFLNPGCLSIAKTSGVDLSHYLPVST